MQKKTNQKTKTNKNGSRRASFQRHSCKHNQRHAPLCKPWTICQRATWAQHLYNSWRQNVVAGNSSQGAQRAEHILDCCIRLTGFDLESLWADVSHCRNCTQAVPPVLAPVWEKWPAGEGLHSKSNKKRVEGGKNHLPQPISSYCLVIRLGTSAAGLFQALPPTNQGACDNLDSIIAGLCLFFHPLTRR